MESTAWTPVVGSIVAVPNSPDVGEVIALTDGTDPRATVRWQDGQTVADYKPGELRPAPAAPPGPVKAPSVSRSRGLCPVCGEDRAIIETGPTKGTMRAHKLGEDRCPGVGQPPKTEEPVAVAAPSPPVEAPPAPPAEVAGAPPVEQDPTSGPPSDSDGEPASFTDALLTVQRQAEESAREAKRRAESFWHDRCRAHRAFLNGLLPALGVNGLVLGELTGEEEARAEGAILAADVQRDEQHQARVLRTMLPCDAFLMVHHKEGGAAGWLLDWVGLTHEAPTLSDLVCDLFARGLEPVPRARISNVEADRLRAELKQANESRAELAARVERVEWELSAERSRSTELPDFITGLFQILDPDKAIANLPRDTDSALEAGIRMGRLLESAVVARSPVVVARVAQLEAELVREKDATFNATESESSAWDEAIRLEKALRAALKLIRELGKRADL